MAATAFRDRFSDLIEHFADDPERLAEAVDLCSRSRTTWAVAHALADWIAMYLPEKQSDDPPFLGFKTSRESPIEIEVHIKTTHGATIEDAIEELRRVDG